MAGFSGNHTGISLVMDLVVEVPFKFLVPQMMKLLKLLMPLKCMLITSGPLGYLFHKVPQSCSCSIINR